MTLSFFNPFPPVPEPKKPGRVWKALRPLRVQGAHAILPCYEIAAGTDGYGEDFEKTCHAYLFAALERHDAHVGYMDLDVPVGVVVPSDDGPVNACLLATEFRTSERKH